METAKTKTGMARLIELTATKKGLYHKLYRIRQESLGWPVGA